MIPFYLKGIIDDPFLIFFVQSAIVLSHDGRCHILGWL
jgi:hypothetical protein